MAVAVWLPPDALERLSLPTTMALLPFPLNAAAVLRAPNAVAELLLPCPASVTVPLPIEMATLLSLEVGALAAKLVAASVSCTRAIS